jgi:hypothetical protein
MDKELTIALIKLIRAIQASNLITAHVEKEKGK